MIIVILILYFFREHSLNQWQFCNIKQVSEGPQRWLRYFRARRRVEKRMDTGRPLKDYRVSTIRTPLIIILLLIFIFACIGQVS